MTFRRAEDIVDLTVLSSLKTFASAAVQAWLRGTSSSGPFADGAKEKKITTSLNELTGRALIKLAMALVCLSECNTAINHG